LRELLPDSLHLLGGLCLICVHREGPGHASPIGPVAVNVGYHSGPAMDDAARMTLVEENASLFRAAGIDSQRWRQSATGALAELVWNIPYNGLVLLGAGTTPLMADADSRALIQALMAEVVKGAKACGHDMPPGYAEYLFTVTEENARLLAEHVPRFSAQTPLELKRFTPGHWPAKAAGCEVPRIEALYRTLGFIDRRNT
jgi:2-dehydropantoate 2-reductase